MKTSSPRSLFTEIQFQFILHGSLEHFYNKLIREKIRVLCNSFSRVSKCLIPLHLSEDVGYVSYSADFHLHTLILTQFFFYEGVEDHEVIIAIIVNLFTNMCRYSISSEYTLHTSNYAIQIQNCCSENVKKKKKIEGYIYFYG